jgi:hypothetical protein
MIVSKGLLFEPVEQREVESEQLLSFNEQGTLEIRTDYFKLAVWTDSHLAVKLAISNLITLIEHIIERLIYALQVQDNAECSFLHAICNISN